MKEDSVIFIGLDTSKLKISVAVADGARNGEVRFFGDISSEPASVASMVNKLSKRGAKLYFCYEAGPTGYGLYRQIVELGHDCVVVAPSLVPGRPGEDEPPRCGKPGTPAPGGGADRGLGSGREP
jgi:transposase